MADARAETPEHAPQTDVAVVGAGLGGLAHAFWRRAHGERVVVLEATTRVGGVVRTETREGFRLQRAASSVPSTARWVRALVDAVPAAPALVPVDAAAARPLLWTRRGLAPAPRSPAALLSGALPPGATVRLLAEGLRGPRRTARPETLEAFVRRRMGSSVAARLLSPFTRGVYGAAPARLGAGDAFPRLAALEARRGGLLRGLLAERPATRRALLRVEGGTEALARAVAAALGPSLHLGSPVHEASATGEGRVVLRCAASEGAAAREVVAREVVLAIPHDAQAALVRPLAPHAAEILAGVRWTPLALVAVGFPVRGNPDVPDAFGFLVAPGTRARILGATFSSRIDASAAPPDHALVLAYVGGTEDPDALALEDARIAAFVVDDLSRALGGRIVPTMVDVHRLPRALPLPSPGHRGRMARAQTAVDPFGVRLLGSHVTGVALDDVCRPR
jgi:oxygen-dependent protoporphyrinogen oxidase